MGFTLVFSGIIPYHTMMILIPEGGSTFQCSILPMSVDIVSEIKAAKRKCKNQGIIKVNL